MFVLCLQGATKLTKDDIERVFNLYDRVSSFELFPFPFTHEDYKSKQ